MVRTGIICVFALLVTMGVVPFAGATGDGLWEAPMNPEFIRYMEAGDHPGDMAVTAVEEPATDATQPLGLIPTPIYRPTVKDVPMFASPEEGSGIPDPEQANILTSGSAGLSTLPPRYDLREQGRMTPVKNQYPWGTCWAFATFSSLESTLLPVTPIPDYSEKNLVNLAGFDVAIPSDGGNMAMSTAYLTRWNGPVDEATDPYPLGPKNNWSSSNQYPPVKHVQNVVFFPARTNRTDTANLKGALVRWGAVHSSFCWYSNFYNKTHFSYYQPPTNLSIQNGHAVTIAGWDDTYEATNFTVTPEGPGAWIVKNSWGATWGNAGYFHISYYDKHFGSAIRPDGTYKNTAAFLGESTSNYDRVYSYERLGEVNDIAYNTNKTGGFANVFTVNSSGTLSAIGLYTTDMNVTCTISIYKNPTSGPVGGSPAATVEKTLPYMGYNTVVIPPLLQVPLAAGNTFSVVVQVTNPTNDYYIPVEENQRNYTANITSVFGQDYLLGSTGWVDLKTFQDNSHVCLKAYTRSTTSPPVANFTSDITSGNAPLAVQFTDHSTSSPTGWNWSFGDDNYTVVQNPVHVYTIPGTYTVCLNATNLYGSNISSKTGYITVVSKPAVITINNETSINMTIAHASCGDIIVLNPGIYFENGILVEKNITLRANTTAGGSPVDTIIEGMSASPRIITVLGKYTLVIDNLSLRNGKAANGMDGINGFAGYDGGAIHTEGTVMITSSIIANCSAGNGGNAGNLTNGNGGKGGDGGKGGAIYADGSVTVTASTISGSSAGSGGHGGAAIADAEGVCQTYPTHEECFIGKGGEGGSGGFGGAVYAKSPVTVTASTISNCTSGYGGQGGLGDTGSYGGSGIPGGNTTLFIGKGGEGGAGGDGAAIATIGLATVSGSTITGCIAGAGGRGGNGGAGGGGTVESDKLVIGQGGYGGSGGDAPGISAGGTIQVSLSSIAGCSAGSGGLGGPGGAGGDAGTGGNGGKGGSGGENGAIASRSFYTHSINVTSTTISGCSAGAGGNGGTGGDGYKGGYGGKGGSGGEAGAISTGALSSAGLINVTSTAISGCHAGTGGNGGMRGAGDVGNATGGEGGSGGSGAAVALLAVNDSIISGSIIVTSSTISDCSAGAGGSGGSGSGMGGKGGGAGGSGGDGAAIAVLSMSTQPISSVSIVVTSTSITNCSAGTGGDGGASGAGGTGGEGGCGGSGGAIGTLSLTNSNKTVSYGSIGVVLSNISGCSTGVGENGDPGIVCGKGVIGDAVGIWGGIAHAADTNSISLISSTISGCHAGSGGNGGSGISGGKGGEGNAGGIGGGIALGAGTNSVSLISSTISGCHAGTGGNGGSGSSGGNGGEGNTGGIGGGIAPYG
jgi:C1A family cysteine protease